jgi:hypothetical protein
LEYKRNDLEKALPSLAHGKHLMSGIAMMEEGLGEKAQIPMSTKENEDFHERNLRVRKT